MDIGIAEIFIHEEHSLRKKINDIAVIRLERKITYSDFIRPICLPSRDMLDTVYDGVDLTVAAWGATNFTGERSDIKLKVSLFGASKEYCESNYRPDYNITSASQICAVGLGGGGTCQGDSGAPLMAFNDTDPDEKFWYLVGVSTFGKICGVEGVPDVYGRVSYFYDWILTKIR